MFWDDLSPDDQQILLDSAVRRTFPAGAILFRAGDQPSHAIIVLSGLVKLILSSPSGRQVVIELRSDGTLLGELGPVLEAPRTATAVVVEPADVAIVTAERFRLLLKQRASLSYAVLRVVTRKLQQATGRRIEAQAGDVQVRLCRRLAELADHGTIRPDGVVEVRSPLTQQELGDWLGVSRDAVVLALQRIRGLGWIETGRRTIRIIDLDALKRAGEP